MPNQLTLRTHPILFQGDLTNANYFEGWYYKQVSPDQQTSLSFIPGISLNPEDSHAFIQYILVEAQTTHTGYIKFPLDAFAYSNKPFAVKIANNYFSEDTITIDIQDNHYHFQGQLNLGPLSPIQKTLIQPNIMGPFAYMPKMECSHGVISMSHSLAGQMAINQQLINFTGGKGYIEKDWGTSFPKHYIWLHSNHFADDGTSLFFSIAHIPFLGRAFEGFICNLLYRGKEYRFATYNLSRCRINHLSGQNVHLTLENHRSRLEIQANIADQAELIAPVQGTMQKTIKEGISGKISIHLHDKKTNETYQDTGLNAGVEIVDYPWPN